MSFPSTPHLPPVPDTPPQPRVPTPADTKPGRHTGRSLFLLLLVPPALTITIIVVMRNMGAYGKSKLIGTIILCCLGLLVVIGAVATLLASVQDLRAAKRSGDRRAVRKQLDNLASMTCGAASAGPCPPSPIQTAAISTRQARHNLFISNTILI